MWQKQLKHYKKQLTVQNTSETKNQSKSIPARQAKIEETDLEFKEYCKTQNITPIKQDTIARQKTSSNKPGQMLQIAKSSYSEHFDFLDISEVAKEFFRFGQKNLPKELRLNKYSLNHTLDLHNLTKTHALQLVEQLLETAAPGSLIEIIHGWGINSEANQPILMGTIRKFLQNHPLVLAYSYGATNQGGNGVTLVKLTKK